MITKPNKYWDEVYHYSLLLKSYTWSIGAKGVLVFSTKF